MSESDRIRAIRAKTRVRLLFALVALASYFAFILNWIDGPDRFLADRLGDSHVNGSLLFFVALILFFIGLELLFLFLYRANRQEGE